MVTRGRSAIGLLAAAVLLSACTAPLSSSSLATEPGTPALPSGEGHLTPGPTVGPATSSPTVTSGLPLVPLSAAMKSIGPAGRIFFYRSAGAPETRGGPGDRDWPPRAFLIDPDGSNEIAIAERGVLPGLWSPDGDRLLVRQFAGDRSIPPGPDNQWVRPALINADGSGFDVLDGYPNQHVNLVPLGWSPDGSRLFVYDGFDGAKTSDMGTFTVRASDGGDLSSVLPASSDVLERPDFVHVSPDGTMLLISRQPKPGDPNVFVLKVGERKLRQVNPAGTVSSEGPIADFLERGSLSEAWSPDGSRIAFCVYIAADDSTALYVANPDGTDLRQIVPTDVGAVSGQWSPDGEWIAFTSRLRSEPQVWVVHPDGTGLQRLTDGTDGSTSVSPVWSPDGTRLLFERMDAGVVTLWTMKVDGSSQAQLTSTPLGTDYVGPYDWLPASNHQ